MARNRVLLNLRALNRLMSSKPFEQEAVKALERVKSGSGVRGLEVVPSPHKWTAGATLRTTRFLRDGDVNAILGAVSAEANKAKSTK